MTKKTENKNTVTLNINEEKKGYELTFTVKPSEDVRESLKKNGWKWNGKKSVWYIKQSKDALIFAKALCNIDDIPVDQPKQKKKADKPAVQPKAVKQPKANKQTDTVTVSREALEAVYNASKALNEAVAALLK